MLGITVFCLVSGVAVNFPRQTAVALALGGFVGLPIFSVLFLGRSSNHPLALLFFSAMGVVYVGGLAAPLAGLFALISPYCAVIYLWLLPTFGALVGASAFLKTEDYLH